VVELAEDGKEEVEEVAGVVGTMATNSRRRN
jgi:hypothetical protein